MLIGQPEEFWVAVRFLVESVENEANPQTRDSNDDNYQIIATKIYLIQNSSLIKISVIKGKQQVSLALI